MTSSFKDSLPKDLVTHVRSMCGRRGTEWLDSLERTVVELEHLWAVKVREPFPAGEFNFVAPATNHDGELAVLKISPPFETVEIFSEAAYLRSRKGRGAVRLLGESSGHRAILIEHALPGESMADVFKGNETAAVEPAIEVLQSILLPIPQDPANITTLNIWFDGLRRYPSTQFSADYASKALAIYDELSRQPNRTFYLHADFHPGNVVSATRSPFLAIDPKGIIGHIGYEVAVFLNNFHWWQETRSDIRYRLDRAVAQFADAFAIAPVELRRWAFAQTVLGAWWTFEDMPEIYAGEVAKADIWDV